MSKFKLGVVGAGNMAAAILNGIKKSDLLAPSQIAVCDKNAAALENFSDYTVTDDNDLIYENAEYLLLAVKPQIFSVVAPDIKAKSKADFIISIMAGVNVNKLRQATDAKKVFRIMPNTPCKIGEGMSVIASNAYDKSANDFVTAIFDSLGKTIVLDESLFDVVTSISGSGPAYVYYFIQAMVDSGVKNGLSYEQSKLLAVQTFIGAAKMVDASNEPIESLIDAVCSKGGTTVEAIDSFKRDDVRELIQKGVEKCKEKSALLGKNS